MVTVPAARRGSFHGRARRACDFKSTECDRGSSPTVSEGVKVAQTLVCDSPGATQTEARATKPRAPDFESEGRTLSITRSVPSA